MENTIVEEVKWNILSNFQTMWIRLGDDDDTHLLLKWNAKMNVVCILWELRDEFLQHSCHPHRYPEQFYYLRSSVSKTVYTNEYLSICTIEIP